VRQGGVRAEQRHRGEISVLEAAGVANGLLR
jgi:hypothetical protein